MAAYPLFTEHYNSFGDANSQPNNETARNESDCSGGCVRLSFSMAIRVPLTALIMGTGDPGEKDVCVCVGSLSVSAKVRK